MSCRQLIYIDAAIFLRRRAIRYAAALFCFRHALMLFAASRAIAMRHFSAHAMPLRYYFAVR